MANILLGRKILYLYRSKRKSGVKFNIWKIGPGNEWGGGVGISEENPMIFLEDNMS